MTFENTEGNKLADSLTTSSEEKVDDSKMLVHTLDDYGR